MTKTKWESGTLHWLDFHSGDGMVKSSDGSLYYVHKTAFKTLDGLSDGKKIEFKLLSDITFQQVEKARIVQ